MKGLSSSATVPEDGTVFHLGDFAFGGWREWMSAYSRLNGKIYLIILNHNPFLCYGGAYNGAWQLFGHVHSGPRSKTGKDIPCLSMLFPTQYDVGVDNNGFKPVSFDELKLIIQKQQGI